MRKMFGVLMSIFMLLMYGCGPSPTDSSVNDKIDSSPSEIPSTEIPPTNVPTEIPTAVPTPTLVPTPLPEGIIFRDDFDGYLQPGWEWKYEKPDNWTITDDGHLQIIGEKNSLLINGEQSNLLFHSLPDGNYSITVHLFTKPFENFHQAAIFLYEDSENYIAINRGYCDLCVPNGNAIFMEYKINGIWNGYNHVTDAEEVYLRLEFNDDTISGFFATELGEWTRIGRFGNFYDFDQVAIGVSNSGGENDLVGLYDYFEIAIP